MINSSFNIKFITCYTIIITHIVIIIPYIYPIKGCEFNVKVGLKEWNSEN